MNKDQSPARQAIDKAGGIRPVARELGIHTEQLYRILKSPERMTYPQSKKLKALGIDPELFYTED